MLKCTTVELKSVTMTIRPKILKSEPRTKREIAKIQKLNTRWKTQNTMKYLQQYSTIRLRRLKILLMVIAPAWPYNPESPRSQGTEFLYSTLR